MKKSSFKAGAYKQQYGFKSFTPSLINAQFTWADPKIDVLLEEATRFLGELNGYYAAELLRMFSKIETILSASLS